MYCKNIFIALLAWVSISLALAQVQISERDAIILRDMLKGGNGYGVMARGEGGSPWITILKGLLRSQHFAQFASEIPCDIIGTLESDADAAELFVKQVEAGQVPTIIEDLPQEVVQAFTSLLTFAMDLPGTLLQDAESSVDEAGKIFDDIMDGNIVSDIENIPGEVASDITAAWGDVTAGWGAFTSGVACFFEGCTTATPGSCATTSVSVPANATLAPAQQVNNSTASLTYYPPALSSAIQKATQAGSAEATATNTALRPASFTTTPAPTLSTSVVTATMGSTIAQSGAAVPLAMGAMISWVPACMLVGFGVVALVL